MKTAKLFNNGGSQAVRLPKDFQFEGSEVHVNKVGEVVILTPVTTSRNALMSLGVSMMPDDFMDDYEPLPIQEREGI